MSRRLAATYGQDTMRGEYQMRDKKDVHTRPGGGGNDATRSMSEEYAGGDAWAASGSSSSGTSIFDPVLCELAYRWFCPRGGQVLDPFAGGSVRGVVASRLGLRYFGCELREEQVEANRKQAETICQEPRPQWHVGDSREIVAHAAGLEADFLFSCPPYADLEVYSKNPLDISTLPYDQFRDAYFKIIGEACTLLRQDRFACFVVGEARGSDGNYYGFVPDTVRAFQQAGLRLYNEAVLVTAVGSLPIRVGRQFAVGRKLGKTHQNVLVFVRGDGKKATEACGDCDFCDPELAQQFGEVLGDS